MSVHHYATGHREVTDEMTKQIAAAMACYAAGANVPQSVVDFLDPSGDWDLNETANVTEARLRDIATRVEIEVVELKFPDVPDYENAWRVDLATLPPGTTSVVFHASY